MKNDLINSSIKVLKKRLSNLEHEILSLDTRIADIEWQYEVVCSDNERQSNMSSSDLLHQRRRTIDKKMYVIGEMMNIKEKLVELEMGNPFDE